MDAPNAAEGSSSDSPHGMFSRALSRKPTQLSHDVLVVKAEEDLPAAPSTTQPSNVVRNSLLAGSVSGMASTLALYPMDLLRTNMQQAASTAAGTGIAGGPLQVLRQTLQLGGIRALYTGLALPLAAQAVYKGTVFTVNNTLEMAILDFKRRHGQLSAELSMQDRLFCGFVAGAVNAGLFVTPVEYVRNQLIAQQSRLATASSRGPSASSVAVGTSWSVVRNAIQVDGVHTLWRGIGITILRDGVGVACFFSAISLTQKFLLNAFVAPEAREHDAPPFWIRVVSGGMGGLSYWVSSLPLDTVKTWIQSADASTSVSPRRALAQIYAESGLWGVVGRLNRGWQVAYGRGIPSSAITIGVYSYVHRALVQYDERAEDGKR